MARLVFSGVFDRHPNLKIVTHHLGGGMIPFFDGRIGAGMEVLGSRTSDEDYSKVLSSLKRPHLDYFRDFYADTSLFGAGNGLTCGLDFFGADRVVFSTDAPLGPIAKTIAAVDALDLDPGAREKITRTNAERLLGMKLS
jgi:aminocarboxymuconate-semialdehyde decarboxylase